MAKEKKNINTKELTEKGVSGAKKFIAEFKAFALKGNVLDLAVAVIIGGVFQSIINSVVNDLIMPLIGLIFKFDFSNLFIPLTNEAVEISPAVPAVMSGSDIITPEVPAVMLSPSDMTYAQLNEYGVAAFKYGNFITAVINFIIMALVIFLLVKGINKLANLRKKPEAEAAPAAPTTKVCPFCKSEINIEATRCPHCTSKLDE